MNKKGTVGHADFAERVLRSRSGSRKSAKGRIQVKGTNIFLFVAVGERLESSSQHFEERGGKIYELYKSRYKKSYKRTKEVRSVYGTGGER